MQANVDLQHNFEIQRRLRVFKSCSAVFLALIFFLYIAPVAVLNIILNRHVEYSPGDAPTSGICSPSEFNLTPQDTLLLTEDGEHVWCSQVLPKSEPKGVVICLSGLINPSVTHYYGSAAFLAEHGYATILLETRAHGNSSGDMISLGYNEVLDVKAVLEYINANNQLRDIPIIILGVSMGGSTAINAFGLYNEIDACIAMSPYCSFETQAALWVDQFIPKEISAPTVYNSMQYALINIFGSKALTITPEKQILNSAGRPMLIIAAADDPGVMSENSRILHSLYPNSELWLRNSDTHLIINDSDYRNVINDTEYCQKILDFLNNVCN